PEAANHLLLGDVGTGKTVVAAIAVAAAVDTRCQALFAAPTEVLARQHGKSLGPLFDAAGISYGVLTGSTSMIDREAMIALFSEGLLDVLIGTHALLEEDVRAKRLSLVVIDEQQRFGVDQRAALLAKGEAPDALYLTATPIPRSLALAIFGDLSLSYIKKRPRDTVNRTTHVVQKDQRGQAYDAALEALSRGEQVYVVCPLIGKDADERNVKAGKDEEGLISDESWPAICIEGDEDLLDDDVAAASREAKVLQETVFVDYRVELLHGKIPAAEKQAVMDDFRSGKVGVLVATTVIEVGVDVPRATVMIIEEADRFGLSQLHQLRGRVGRGELPAQVFLVSASKQDAALARLGAMQSTDDGFELASYDLSLRREGDILGNRQHGASACKLVNVVRDAKMIEAARADALSLLAVDPDLSDPDHQALARELRIMFDDKGEVLGG
ncbi:MAG: DEAD/DEAH box helicase, partial [Eggerthellaceae bacterium]|nr:DEAD/DEAH box helicase [Eggerthellaceae bacterium]